MPQRRGFTLLELLVVVVILGVLIAILLPSLRAARQHASRVACAAQLKGLVFGVRTFMEENDLTLPVAAEVPSINAPVPPIPEALKSQVPDAHAWKCNGDSLGYTRLADGKRFASRYLGETTSYEYNQYLSGKRIERGYLAKFLGDRGIWVLIDMDNYHGEPATKLAKNIAFGDGHVGDVEDLTEPFAPAP